MEPAVRHIVRLADVQELPDPVPDIAVMRSEADVLQSRSVIEPVVRSLKLWESPEFQDQGDCLRAGIPLDLQASARFYGQESRLPDRVFLQRKCHD